MKIYVGNLAYTVSDEDLRKAFEAFGKVESANVVKDQYSDRSRGFGFVEMPESGEAQTAIKNLNGKDLGGRTLNVNEANSKPQRSRGGDSRGRRGGRGWR